MNRTEPKWKTLKAQGRSHYQDGNYAQALRAYQDALASLNNNSSSSSNPSFGGVRGGDSTECQLLLSNSVACRLKLGGREMALKAVEEAKQVRSQCRLRFTFHRNICVCVCALKN